MDQAGYSMSIHDDWLNSEPRRILAELGPVVSERKLRLYYSACCRRIWQYIGDQRARQAVEAAERFADGLVGPASLLEARRAARYAVCDGKRAEWEGEAEANFQATAKYYDLQVRLFAASAVKAVVAETARDAHGGWDHYQHAEVVDPPRWDPPDVPPRASDYWCVVTIGRARAAAILREHSQDEARPIEPEDEHDRIRRTAHHARDEAEAAETRRLTAVLRCVFGHTPARLGRNPDWLAWNNRAIPTLARAIYKDRTFGRMAELAEALGEAGCGDDAILRHCRGPEPHVRGCWVLDLLLGKE